MTLVEVFLQSSDYLEARWSVTALLPLNICKIQNFENEINRTKLLRVFCFLNRTRIDSQLACLSIFLGLCSPPDQILSFLETVGYVSFTWLLVYSGHIAAKKCLE